MTKSNIMEPWQPMERASRKAGHRILGRLLFCEKLEVIIVSWSGGKKGVWNDDNGQCSFDNNMMTGWMELPKP